MIKRLATLFLLILFVLPGCAKQAPDLNEVPLPDSPPNPVDMQPTFPPPAS